MKTRQAFVANSSSSSFLIKLDDLTGSQIFKIKEHIREARDMDGINCPEPTLDFEWNVYQTETHLTGSVFMDNFNMYRFMENIGVDMSKVKWED